MKVLRILVALAVLAYAGWLAWPLLSPLLDGGAPDAGAMRTSVEAQASDTLLGTIPPWAFWAGAIGLYLIAALMLGAGNPRAAVAYFLGFLADAVLRLAIDRQGDGGGSADVAARSGPSSMSVPDTSGLPVEPVWLILGALLVLGVLIVIVTRRQRSKRSPGQFAG